MMTQKQDLVEKAQDQVKDTSQKVKQNGLVADLLEAQASMERSGVNIPALLATCLFVGVTFGTVFQVTHNNGYLPVSIRTPSHSK